MLTGKIITVNNQLKFKYKKEVQGILSGKQVMENISNTIQHSQEKEIENN